MYLCFRDTYDLYNCHVIRTETCLSVCKATCNINRYDPFCLNICISQKVQPCRERISSTCSMSYPKIYCASLISAFVVRSVFAVRRLGNKI